MTLSCPSDVTPEPQPQLSAKVPGLFVPVPTSIYPSVQRHEINADAFLIHSVLLAHAWRESDECSVSRERLSFLAGCTAETVNLALEQLIKARHIERAGHKFKLLTKYQRKLK